MANISIRDAADPHVRKDLSLCYNGNGTLWLAFWDEWALEQVEGQWVYDEDSYVRTKAREFRFDTARARYMARDVDVVTLQPVETPGALNLWTDYLGETPVLDYTVDLQTAVAEDLTRYLPGFGVQAHEPIAIGETYYAHGDLIGSTMVLSDATGGPAGAAVAYTAFGEPVGAVPVEYSRYRYAGAWGYESDLLELQGPDQTLPPIGLLHIGWRWYQPSIGRFVQRDPISLGGGLNVYEYVRSDPARWTDSSGLALDYWYDNKFGYTPGFDPNETQGSSGPVEDFLVGVTLGAFGAPIVAITAPLWESAGAATCVQFTAHGLQRLIQRGLTKSVVGNAIKWGTRITQSDGTIMYVYENVVVIVNTAGEVVTVWTTGH